MGENWWLIWHIHIRKPRFRMSWTCICEAITIRQLPRQLFNVRIFPPSVGYSKDIFSRRGLGVISETKNICLTLGHPQPLVGFLGAILHGREWMNILSQSSSEEIWKECDFFLFRSRAADFRHLDPLVRDLGAFWLFACRSCDLRIVNFFNFELIFHF